MNTMPNHDIEILDACLAGDRNVFGEIVERYQSLVCAIAYNATGDLDQSEELAQETFVAAWKNLRQLRDPSKLKSWLCGIARNLSQEWLRRRRRTVSLPEASLDQTEAINEALTPAERIINKEEEAILWRSLEEIPEAYREPLILFYREQQSIAKVAEALDISEDAAKQRLSRGRKMLKEQVAAFVESALSASGPKKAFTIAVLAALPAAAPQFAAAGLAVTASKGSPAAKAVAGLFALGGAVWGTLLGFLEGVIGFLVSYRQAKSTPERQYIVKMSLWCLLYVLAYFGIVFTASYVFRESIHSIIRAHSKTFMLLIITGLTIIYTVGLVLLIKRWNVRLKQIQIEQGTYIDPNETLKKSLAVPPSKRNLIGMYGGSIFGCAAWIYPSSILTKDWITPIAATLFILALFAVSVAASLRHPQKMYNHILTDLVCLFLMNMLVIHLKWSDWKEAVFQGTPLWQMDGIIVCIFICLAQMTGSRKKQIQKLIEENG